MKKSEFLEQIKTELSINLEKLFALDLGEEEDTLKIVKFILSNEEILNLCAKDADGRKQLIVMLETLKAFLQVFGTNLNVSQEDVLNAAKQGEFSGNIRAMAMEKDFYDDI